MTKYQKSNFYKIKKLFKIDDVDVNKVLGSRKEPYGTNKSIKYFIAYNDEFLNALYVKSIYSNKTCEAMSFKVNGNKLLKRYNKIWERVSDLMNIKFDIWYIIW